MKRLGNRAKREGKGVKGDPYTYSRNAIRPSTESRGEDLDESNAGGGIDVNKKSLTLCRFQTASRPLITRK